MLRQRVSVVPLVDSLLDLNLRTSDMVDDANITQDDIADSVSILSVTFITLQPFSTAIGRRVGPKYWIACMMTAWGAACMAHAGTKNRGTLIALRLLLGAFEAGFVPTSFVRNLNSCA
jgi:MFS family permease